MTSNPRPVQILIADDHAIVRRGLRALVESESDYHVCAEAATGREALQKAKQFTPDIAIVDISMPELNGMEAIRQMRRVSPRTKIIVLTMFESEQLLREIIEQDVNAYVLKSDPPDDVLGAVDAVRNGKPYFSGAISTVLLKHYRANVSKPGGGQHLTLREREILQLLAEGASNKSIAKSLNLSIKTVETHRTNI